MEWEKVIERAAAKEHVEDYPCHKKDFEPELAANVEV